MEELTCPVCSDGYAARIREPVILPKCGHTFCRPCLSNLQMLSPSFKCPTCRTPHKGPTVANMPTVYIVLNILERIEGERGTLSVCKSHNDPIRLWCRTCQEELCGQCLFERHMSEKHDIVKTNTAVSEMKQIIEVLSKQISDYVEEEKCLLVQELHGISHQLGRLYNKSQILGSHSKKVKDILMICKTTNQMSTLLDNRCALENMIKNLKPKSAAKNNINSTTEKEKVRGEKNAESHSTKSCKEDQMTSRFIISEISDLNSDAEVFEMSDDDSASSLSEELQDVRAVDRSSHSPVFQENLLSDVTVWPLTHHSPGGRSDWPKLNWYNFLAQIPVVQLLVPPENPLVFLQLGVKGKSLGFIHIRLWGQLRRAQHFLALCLGTLGPSYKGSRFSDVAKRGEPGERLIGGLYETEDGCTGHQIIEGLEWRGEYTGPMRAGVIGGSRGRQPKYNSCFCISTRDYPKGKYYCPFGEVVSGLNVAQEAVQYDPISEVTILDTGMVPPQCDI